MTSFYYDVTHKMLDMAKKGGMNVVSDFFAQLSTIRSIDGSYISSAIRDEEVEFNKLIKNNVQRPEWLKSVSLADIRNYIVFVVYKDHATMIDEANYYDESYGNSLYHDYYKPNQPLNTNVEKLGVILETSYYIWQLSIIKKFLNGFEVNELKPEKWKMYHDWILSVFNEEGLAETVYQNFELMETIL